MAQSCVAEGVGGRGRGGALGSKESWDSGGQEINSSVGFVVNIYVLGKSLPFFTKRSFLI